MPRLSVFSLIATLAFACALLALIGCGSDPPPAPAPVPQPSAESTSLGFAPRAKPKEEPKGLDLSGVDPDELFAVADAAPPNFVTAGVAPPGEVEDRFRLTSRGRDETRFLATSAAAVEDGDEPVALPDGFQAIETEPRIGGLPSRIVCQADGSVMALVPGGPAYAGSNEAPQHAAPQVSVDVSPFYISVMEVTVNQFTTFRRQALKRGDAVEEPANVNGRPEAPALGISWGEARAYALAAGCELPTEVQWEKAARGYNGFPMPWGYSRPLWRVPRTAEQIDTVGVHPDDMSPFGVMDMAGNAQEWLLDFYSETAMQELSQFDSNRRRDWTGPRRPTRTGERVVKGGHPKWQVWARRGQRMTDRHPQTGFRCVLNLTSSR